MGFWSRTFTWWDGDTWGTRLFTWLNGNEVGRDDRGMIFPYDPPREVAFWMKNTLIPLDMIFIRADGTIAGIAANTVPLSLEPVPSVEPVVAVLEIAGGRAAELGIKPGDRVEW